ncbi:MAG: hypothetical protein DWQ08_05335, partial [Proteobacteria bacterium]
MRLFVAVLLAAGACVAAAQGADPRDDTLESLKARDFVLKGRAIDALAEYRDDRTRAILSALLEGNLYYIKDTGRTVIVEDADGGVKTYDAISGEDAGIHGKREVKKLTVNHKLRVKLRGLIADFALSDADPDRRLA